MPHDGAPSRANMLPRLLRAAKRVAAPGFDAERAPLRPS